MNGFSLAMWYVFFAALIYGTIAVSLSACDGKTQHQQPRPDTNESTEARCRYKVGQAVALTSGGPTMTISRVLGSCDCSVVWLNTKGELEGNRFNEAMLRQKVH